MPVGRRVAAIDLPTRQAEAQMQPGPADLHASAAARGRLRVDILHPVHMRASGHGSRSFFIVVSQVLNVYEAVMPPSTGSTAPVRPDEAGPHNQAIKAAGSAGSSRRCTR